MDFNKIYKILIDLLANQYECSIDIKVQRKEFLG